MPESIYTLLCDRLKLVTVTPDGKTLRPGLSPRGHRILRHYQTLWDRFPERQSSGRLEHLLDEAIRNLAGSNGDPKSERTEPRL